MRQEIHRLTVLGWRWAFIGSMLVLPLSIYDTMDRWLATPITLISFLFCLKGVIMAHRAQKMIKQNNFLRDYEYDSTGWVILIGGSGIIYNVIRMFDIFT
jgi:hypothetical protein